MRSPLLALAGAAAVTAASPSAATDKQTRRTFEDYTQCVVKKRPKDAREVVLSTIPAEEIYKRYPHLITPDCLDAAELRMPGSDFLRFGLAQALVRRDYAGGLPPDITSAGPVAHFQPDEADYLPKPGKKLKDKQLAELQKRREQDIAIRTLSVFGECVVRADPQRALTLVLSKSGSPEESKQFAALSETLSSCLLQGVTIKLDKVPLRGTLALNLYRLAHAPRLPAEAAK